MAPGALAFHTLLSDSDPEALRVLFSNRHGFLYIHIAKTGGTSIKTALKKMRWSDLQVIPQLLAYNLSGLTDHRIAVKPPRHARAVVAKDLIPREDFERLFKFAIVRNPWDLQVSAFHHLNKELPEVAGKGGLSEFGAFLRWNLDRGKPLDYPSRFVDPLSERFLDSLCDMDGSLLLDFVGAFERLPQDWAFIQRRLGLAETELPKKRVSKRSRDYRSYYDDDLADLVASHYAGEIEAFGYSFEGGLPDGSLLGVSAETGR
jgi:hypothetical protein